MKVSAAHALASSLDESELGEKRILPRMDDLRVVREISREVIRAAIKSKVGKV